jgi:hypothetical protein
MQHISPQLRPNLNLNSSLPATSSSPFGDDLQRCHSEDGRGVETMAVDCVSGLENSIKRLSLTLLDRQPVLQNSSSVAGTSFTYQPTSPNEDSSLSFVGSSNTYQPSCTNNDSASPFKRQMVSFKDTRRRSAVPPKKPLIDPITLHSLSAQKTMTAIERKKATNWFDVGLTPKAKKAGKKVLGRFREIFPVTISPLSLTNHKKAEERAAKQDAADAAAVRTAIEEDKKASTREKGRGRGRPKKKNITRTHSGRSAKTGRIEKKGRSGNNKRKRPAVVNSDSESDDNVPVRIFF